MVWDVHTKLINGTERWQWPTQPFSREKHEHVCYCGQYSDLACSDPHIPWSLCMKLSTACCTLKALFGDLLAAGDVATQMVRNIHPFSNMNAQKCVVVAPNYWRC